MTLTGKQKSFLRSLAMTKKSIFQVGKDGITPALILSIEDFLLKNELLKINLLATCPLSLDEVAAEMETLHIQVVQIIGKTLVLYRRNPKIENGIELPR